MPDSRSDDGQGAVAPIITLPVGRASQRARPSVPDHRVEGDLEAVAPIAHLPGAVAAGTSSAEPAPATARRAENVSLHALARRGMSRSEVAALLARREIEPDVAEAEIARLEGVGLIDDEALARTLVERLTDRKKLGPSALRGELQRRGLSAATIESALAEHEPDDEVAVLTQLVDDRLRRMGSLDRDTAERRLLGYLARKGHGGSAARDAIRAALDAAGLERVPRTGFGQRSGLGRSSGSGMGGSSSVGQRGRSGFGQRGGGTDDRGSRRGVEFE